MKQLLILLLILLILAPLSAAAEWVEVPTYSEQHLRRVQDEITDAHLGEGTVISVALSTTHNRVRVEILEDKREEDATNALIDTLKAAYGDAVVFEYGQMSVADPATPPYLLWAAVALVPVGAIGAVCIIRRVRKGGGT